VTEWGSYQYIVMPFRLKNAPTVFSRVVVVTIKEFIHKFLEFYLDDWMVFNLLHDHIEFLRLMLDQCRQCHISIELKEVYILRIFWNSTRTCHMKKRTISRSNQYCSNYGVGTYNISQRTEGNVGSYQLLQEIYQRICVDYNTHGKVIE
jgi:hypothetical protein